MADDRIYSLTQETSVDFSKSLIVDKSGLTQAKSITLNTMRKGSVYEQDDVGNTTTTIDYADYNVIELTISLDITATVSNVPENSRNFLKVIKPAAKRITFSGVDGTLDGVQTDKTSLYFEVLNVQGNVSVRQLNVQFSGSLTSGYIDVATYGNTITTFGHFNWTINETQCTLSSAFTINLPGSSSYFQADLSDFGLNIYNTIEPITVYATKAGVSIPAVATINEDTLIVYFSSANTGDIEIKINGTFRVK